MPAEAVHMKTREKKWQKVSTDLENKYSWILHSECQNKAFCEMCQATATAGLFKFSTKKDDAFISDGYANWKNALSKFAKHARSQSHREAVLKMAHRLSGTNVTALLLTAVEQQLYTKS